MDRDWMAIGITLNLSTSSFPPLPPTPPRPFRAPLRPKTSLKEPAIPLPQTRSSPLQHFFPPLLLPTHSFLLSKKTPHGRTQTRPHHAGSSASQTMPQPTPNRNPCHALHSPVSLPTGPWLSSPPLRLMMKKVRKVPKKGAMRRWITRPGWRPRLTMSLQSRVKTLQQETCQKKKALIYFQTRRASPF